MKPHLLWLALAFVAFESAPSLAQTTASAAASDQCDTDDPATYAADCAAAAKLKKALRANDRRAVAHMIDYPLQRELPLRPITNAGAFLKHWDEYFDAVTAKEIIDQKPEQYGWRGIALVNGMVWFKDGRIISINSDADAYKAALAAAKRVEARKLYADAQGYDRIEQQCNTKTLHVRVQKHGDDLRYFAWKRGAPLSGKPQLELKNGTFEDAGSDGGAVLTFKTGDFTYQVDNGAGICGEDCNSYLTVLKGEETISHQVCNRPIRAKRLQTVCRAPAAGTSSLQDQAPWHWPQQKAAC